MNVDSLNIKSLLKRFEEGKFNEIILATNPTVDGETTSMYLAKLLEQYNVKVTRLAYGLQIGGNLDAVGELQIIIAVMGFQLNKLRRVGKSAAEYLMTDLVEVPRNAAAPPSAAQNGYFHKMSLLRGKMQKDTHPTV